jgi:hypothetical protein
MATGRFQPTEPGLPLLRPDRGLPTVAFEFELEREELEQVTEREDAATRRGLRPVRCIFVIASSVSVSGATVLSSEQGSMISATVR